MHVVKNFRQLKQALRNNKQKIMVIGRQAPEILEAISRSGFDGSGTPLYPFLSKLYEKFYMLEVTETNRKVAGILHQKFQTASSKKLLMGEKWQR